jgi:glucose/arabinose dehydrogenase
MKLLLVSSLFFSLFSFVFSIESMAGAKLPLEKIKLPAGFEITVFTDQVPGARSMTMSPGGTLYVGTRDDKGSVYAIPGAAQGKTRVLTIAKDLKMPNGVAFRDGALYVGAVSKILRFDGIEKKLEHPPQPVTVKDDLPTETHHGWKFMAFGPDGKLYIPIGAPCNVCSSKDPRFASISRMNPDGSGFEVIAHGVRNTVGFDWHPKTRELWFTENGRDLLGDDLPPDELNHLSKTGQDFGFPRCHGEGIRDPEFGGDADCKSAQFTPPARALGAHVAALGMRFYEGSLFPAEYRGEIFVAEHGSWNRTHPDGYRVMHARLEGNRVVSYDAFAEGWLQEEKPWGRPVDVLVAPDGALLVSDDKAGVIYRIAPKKAAKSG